VIKAEISRKQAKHKEKGRPWYDTKEGIVEAVKSLPSFLRLVSARRKAHYVRDEKLNTFYVLGRYCLDACGNCCRAEGVTLKDKFPHIKDVLTKDESDQFIDAQTNGKDLFITHSYSDNLPDLRISCPVCGQKWSINNCHDTVVVRNTQNIPLDEFVGKTLAAVKKHYGQKTNAEYFMQDDILIRNDRFIDLSPKYPKPENEYERKAVKNKSGWVAKRDGITDKYVIQKGDVGYFNVWRYYHSKCDDKAKDNEMRQRFHRVFEKAGFGRIRMSSTKNRYSSARVYAPWYYVNTEHGTFLIGWRKRVINIDWKGLGAVAESGFGDLFISEDVTKANTYIHAYGYDKAMDYLQRIRKYLEQNR